MHMRTSLHENNRNTTITNISCDGTCVYMLPVLGDSSTCCHQRIDHDVYNRPFLHQNGTRVAAPLKSNISLYERCNRARKLDLSSKLRKKLRIYDVKEYSSVYRNTNRTIDLF